MSLDHAKLRYKTDCNLLKHVENSYCIVLAIMSQNTLPVCKQISYLALARV